MDSAGKDRITGWRGFLERTTPQTLADLATTRRIAAAALRQQLREQDQERRLRRFLGIWVAVARSRRKMTNKWSDGTPRVAPRTNVGPRKSQSHVVAFAGRHRRGLHDHRERAPVVLEHREHDSVRAPKMHRRWQKSCILSSLIAPFNHLDHVKVPSLVARRSWKPLGCSMQLRSGARFDGEKSSLHEERPRAAAIADAVGQFLQPYSGTLCCGTSLADMLSETGSSME